MNKPKRPVVCVVAAEANSIEQREILKGIIAQAQSYDYDTAVISNVYNPNVDISFLNCENRIYELIASNDISAIILISESFVNDKLKNKIADLLLAQKVPVVVVGSYIPVFDNPRFHFVNTDDIADIEAITDHLIEEHSFTDIDILTGHEQFEVSHQRVEGYKKSLERHSLPFNSKKVHFGTFWMDSGKELAEKYVNGDLPFPQAVVCANDYMAYGMLDVFAKNNIKVPEKISVVGYEYINQRNMYTPLLTTYQRNRQQLGINAVNIIHNQLTGSRQQSLKTPKGRMILGNSCPCGCDNDIFIKELDDVKRKRDFEFWNLFTSLDQEITESKNLDDFVVTLGKYHWLVRDAFDIFLCLASDWYETSPCKYDIMSCRTIMPWLDHSPFELTRLHFAEIFSHHNAPSVYYFTPVFFGEKMFGHIITRYDTPDTYDDIFRNWIKAVSIALEFLRMKNDIKYLTECQNLSEQRDTLTGMFNASGIEKAYKSAILHGSKELYFVLLKVCLFNDTVAGTDANKRVEAILAASKAVIKFCGNHDICGRVSDNTFVCIVQRNASADLLSDCVSAILSQHKKYMEIYGIDSFVCTAEKCGDRTFSDVFKSCCAAADEKIAAISDKKLINHYKRMSEIRNYVYLNSSDTFDTESLHERFPGSTGYLRSVFKQCFDTSFHKDCITARVSKAKYYLSTTTMNVIEISEKCGYIDSKYFLRQFGSVTGMTPIQYRNQIQG